MIWPFAVKAIAISGACLLLIALFILADVIPQIKKLKKERQSNLTLEKMVEATKHQAADADKEQAQMVSMKKTFFMMLHQLPREAEMPGLIEAISKKGLERGLHFYSIKPLQEKHYDFYSALPIEILVRGRYHGFAEFISDMSALQRIVTIGDFDIHAIGEGLNKPISRKHAMKKYGKSLLEMKVVAKAYRYYGEDEKSEIALQKHKDHW